MFVFSKNTSDAKKKPGQLINPGKVLFGFLIFNVHKNFPLDTMLCFRLYETICPTFSWSHTKRLNNI